MDVLGGVELTLNVSSYFQEPNFFRREKDLEKDQTEQSLKFQREHFEESVRISKNQHKEAVKLDKKTHIRGVANSLEEHLHELNAGLISSTRDAERSMYDQRNAEFQTLIISSTVMFSGLSTVIIQGYLPHPATETNGLAVIYVLMACACGLSFAFLFICIVLFMKVVVRTSKFMYERSNRETQRVIGIIGDSMSKMQDIRSRREFSDDMEWKSLSKHVYEVHDGIIKSFIEDEEIHEIVDGVSSKGSGSGSGSRLGFGARITQALRLGTLSPVASRPQPTTRSSRDRCSEKSALCIGTRFGPALASYGSLRSMDSQSTDSQYYKDAVDDYGEFGSTGDADADADADTADCEDDEEKWQNYNNSEEQLSVASLRQPYLQQPSTSLFFSREDSFIGEEMSEDSFEQASNNHGGYSPLPLSRTQRAASRVRHRPSFTSLRAFFSPNKHRKCKDDSRPGSFERFFETHCAAYVRLAFWLFFVGTSAFQVSCAVFMYAQFTVIYENLPGAIVSVVFICISLVIGLFISLYMDNEIIESDD